MKSTFDKEIEKDAQETFLAFYAYRYHLLPHSACLSLAKYDEKVKEFDTKHNDAKNLYSYETTRYPICSSLGPFCQTSVTSATERRGRK